MIKIAKHLPTGKMLHVDLAMNGLSCNCVCEECGERLQAVQPTQHNSFYRHHVNVNCQGAQESALHKLGKQMVKDGAEMVINANQKISYREVILEPSVGEYRSGAQLTTDHGTYYCEIVVKHGLTPEKEEYYRSIGKCIEIDLSAFVGKDYSYDEIRNAVLIHFHNKRLIQAVLKPAKVETDFWEALKPVAFLVLLFMGIRALIRRL